MEQSRSSRRRRSVVATVDQTGAIPAVEPRDENEEHVLRSASQAMPQDVDRLTALAGHVLLMSGTAVSGTQLPSGAFIRDFVESSDTAALSALQYVSAGMEGNYRALERQNSVEARRSMDARGLFFGISGAAEVVAESERRERVFHAALEASGATSRGEDPGDATVHDTAKGASGAGPRGTQTAASLLLAFDNIPPATADEISAYDHLVRILIALATEHDALVAEAAGAPEPSGGPRVHPEWQREARQALAVVTPTRWKEATAHAVSLLCMLRLLHHRAALGLHVSTAWSEEPARGRREGGIDVYFPGTEGAVVGNHFLSTHEEKLAVLLFRGLTTSRARSRRLGGVRLDVTLSDEGVQGLRRHVVRSTKGKDEVKEAEDMHATATSALGRTLAVFFVLAALIALCGAFGISVLSSSSSRQMVVDLSSKLHRSVAASVEANVTAQLLYPTALSRSLADKMGNRGLPSAFGGADPAYVDGVFSDTFAAAADPMRGNVVALYAYTTDGALAGMRRDPLTGALTALHMPNSSAPLSLYPVVNGSRSGQAASSMALDLDQQSWYTHLASLPADAAPNQYVARGAPLAVPAGGALEVLRFAAHAQASFLNEEGIAEGTHLGWVVAEVDGQHFQREVVGSVLLGSQTEVDVDDGTGAALATSTLGRAAVVDTRDGTIVASSHTREPAGKSVQAGDAPVVLRNAAQQAVAARGSLRLSSALQEVGALDTDSTGDPAFLLRPPLEAAGRVNASWAVLVAAPPREYLAFEDRAFAQSAIFIAAVYTIAIGVFFLFRSRTLRFFEAQNRNQLMRILELRQRAACPEEEGTEASQQQRKGGAELRHPASAGAGADVNDPAAKEHGAAAGPQSVIARAKAARRGPPQPGREWMFHCITSLMFAAFVVQFAVWTQQSSATVEAMAKADTAQTAVEVGGFVNGQMDSVGIAHRLLTDDIRRGTLPLWNETTKEANSTRIISSLYLTWSATEVVADWGLGFLYYSLTNGVFGGLTRLPGHAWRADVATYVPGNRVHPVRAWFLSDPLRAVYNRSAPSTTFEFNPLGRVWYTSPPRSGGLFVTDPFLYGSNFGDTVAMAYTEWVKPAEGTDLALSFVADFTTGPLAARLHRMDIAAEKQGVIMALGARWDGPTLASSDTSYNEAEVNCEGLPMPDGTDTEAVTAIHRSIGPRFGAEPDYEPNFVRWTGYGNNRAYTVLQAVKRRNTAVVVITSFWKRYYVQELLDWQRISFLLAATLIIINLFIVSLLARRVHSVVADATVGRAKQRFLQIQKEDEQARLGGDDSDFTVLDSYRLAVGPYVARAVTTLDAPPEEPTSAFARARRGLMQRNTLASPLHVGLAAATRAKEAMKAALAGHKVLRLLDMEVRGQGVRVRVYKLFTSKAYTLGVMAAITGLLLLAFWEGHSSKALVDDSFASVAVAELVFLLFLLLDCALDATAIGVHHRSYGGVHPDTPLGFSATVGAPRRDLILRFTVLVIMLGDWVARVFVGYRTGDWVARVFVGYRTGDGGAFTLPYTAVLRPVVLALRSGPTRRAFHIFVGTLLSARDTLLLIFAFVAVSAVVCMVLLRNVVTGDGDRARGFATYHDSWLTLFTYLFTSDNFATIMVSASDTSQGGSRVYKLLFSLLTVIGTFIIVSLIIAIFQSRYMERREKAELSSNQLRRRGLVVAYAYLDPDQDGVLQPHEFRPFFEVCATNVPSSIFNDRNINVREFVLLCEAMKADVDNAKAVTSEEELDRLTSQQESRRSDSKGFGPVRRACAKLHTTHYSTVKDLLVVLIVCHIFACSLLGTSLEEDMESALIVFFCLHWIDIATHIIGLGATDFWGVSRHPFEHVTNRFDLGVMVVAVLVLLGELLGRTTQDAERGTLYRFGLAIPIIRVFGAIGTSRRVVFGLASILPVFSALFGVLVCVFYWFAIVGCMSFSGTLSSLPPAIYPDAKTGNFDSFDAAVGMLVQLSVGTVNTPMLATIDATVSLLPSVYYIAFIVCIVLFYSNAIVGIVIDAYQSMREAFSGEDVHGESEVLARYRAGKQASKAATE